MANGTDRSGTSVAASAPAPGQAPMPAEDAADLLRSNAADAAISQSPAVVFEDQAWTHGEYFAECCRFAGLFESFSLIDRGSDLEPSPERSERGVHIGVLADNTPDYLFALGGAALSGATVVGLNHTRTGAHLWRDLAHTDVDVLLTETRHLAQLYEAIAARPAGAEVPPVLLSRRFDSVGKPGAATVGNEAAAAVSDAGAAMATPALRDVRNLESALAAFEPVDPGRGAAPDATWALVFTSGTSSDPKAVVCTQRRLLTTGNRMSMLLELAPDDVGYVCMPLFHSNALMVGWAPSLVVGASVALARRFSASGWLPDVRRFGATYFNYTGKPLSYILSTAEGDHDADNPVRVAFGNEGSPRVLDGFAKRFDVNVIDAFGSTEGAIALNRDAEARSGAMGVAGETVMVVDEDGEVCPPAEYDSEGRLTNADSCVGEIVNTAGGGPFEGY
ncbi:MAG: AMP-binding protein, partial [Microthrixaceae bacterium]